MKSNCKSCCKVTKPNPFSQSFAILFWGHQQLVRRLELEAFPVETGSDVGKIAAFLGKATMWKTNEPERIIGQKRHVPNRKNTLGWQIVTLFPKGRLLSFLLRWPSRIQSRSHLSCIGVPGIPQGDWASLGKKVPQRNQNPNIDQRTPVSYWGVFFCHKVMFGYSLMCLEVCQCPYSASCNSRKGTPSSIKPRHMSSRREPEFLQRLSTSMTWSQPTNRTLHLVPAMYPFQIHVIIFILVKIEHHLPHNDCFPVWYQICSDML